MESRTFGDWSGLTSSNVLFVGFAAAAGVGCLTYFAWNQWRIRGQSASNDGSTTFQLLRVSTSKMGQGQSVNVSKPFDAGDSSYAPIGSGGVRTGYDDWSITVNPHEESEQQQLIQSGTERVSLENGAVGAREEHPRFKRVIFQSRAEDDDEISPRQSAELSTSSSGREAAARVNGVVTSQPKSSPAVVVTNLRLADKLKGFSNEEYQNTLQGTLNRLYGATKILTVDEAKCLTLLLQQKSSDTLLKTLTTMSNLAAFTVNQDLLKDHGAIELLINLLHDESLSDSTQVMLVQCIGNMAVNQTNNKLFQCCVPRIVHHLISPESSELHRVMCVQALTNLSVDASVNKANDYAPILPILYQRLSLWSHIGVNIPTLRLLVNLSCMADLIPYMLALEGSVDLVDLVSNATISDDILVRATAFLFYLASTVDTLSLDEEEIRAKSSSSTDLKNCTFYKLFRGDGLRRFVEAVDRLKRHQNEEIRERAKRIARHLANIETSIKAK